MSRYRPPTAPASPYITAEGYRALQDELSALWKRRAEVTQALSAAAAEGDRSENAEYIYRKKELRGIDSRIRFLQKRLPDLKVISDIPANQNQIFFGAWVTVEDENGDEHVYRIVGSDEIDGTKGYISIDSPLARTLLKKSPDDEVSVETVQGAKRYLVVEVRYGSHIIK